MAKRLVLVTGGLGFVVALIVMACGNSKGLKEYYLQEATLEVTAKISETIEARCYDQGGKASGSFLLVLGSYSSENYGEACDYFARVTILSHADDYKTNRGAGNWYPSEELPNSLPTQGVIIARVAEGIQLVEPNMALQARLVASEWSHQSLRDKPIMWDLLQILNLEPQP